MSELQPLLEALLSEADANRPAAFCVVVQTKGSTPQCPGAALLLRSDFTAVGTLGGGCVEAEVKRRAFELLNAGRSALLDFRLDHDYGWDDGLICGGNMAVAVMSLGRDTDWAPFRAAADALRHRRPAALPLLVEHEGRQLRYRVHLETPPTLLIAGAGHVGQAVARLAGSLDFHVVVIDDRADCASRDRFDPSVELLVGDIAATLRQYPLDEGCYVVIVTRGHQHDEQALEAVIGRPTRYVGLIGSRRKIRLVFDDLRQAGIPPEQLDRVHTPIGLAIGAVTVPEIAVSIAAQIIQVRRQQTPRLVDGPLEPPSPTA